MGEERRGPRAVGRRAFGPFVAAALGLSSVVACAAESGEDDGGAGEGGSLSGNGGSTAASGGTGGTSASGGSGARGGTSARGGTGTGGDTGMGGAVSPGGTTSQGGAGGTVGGGANGGDGGVGGNDGSGGSSGSGPGVGEAADAAERLGRAPNFLIGMGNDLNNDHNLDGAYTLGVTLDLHYAYLVGLPGAGGWPDWNPGGYFVNILADSADAHGVTPMYDLYTMASRGEANLDPLADPTFMQPYWETLKLLYERLADFDKPAVVHFEPDFWAFAQQQAQNDPASIPTLVSELVPECEDLSDDLAGLGHCMIRLGRRMAPKVLLGFHASRWAGAPADIIAFLNGVGAGESDFIGMDMLDRDAGCFEAGNDPNCTRTDGPWYWDETNQTSPNFHEYIAWSKEVGDGLGVPPLWWQIPFGVPSETPGGVPGAYRDNRVRYIFSHIEEFVAAGGLGAVFGVGSGNQTYITTDGGQFQDAVTNYFAAPVPLP